AGLAGGRVRADGAGLRAHEAVPHAPVHADRADHQGHRVVGTTDPQGLRRHGRDGLRRGRRRGVADHGRAGGGRVRCAPRPARMQFGVFYEHQLPRPWVEGAELKLFQDALDQVELADKLGIDYAWEVEHHFLEEYAHSSAPEVFLAACSQRTKRIRLGHGIVLMPPPYNHPARVAASRRETIHEAARDGIGALTFAFIDPAEAIKWVGEYYDVIKSEACVPIGHSVNANIAMVGGFSCHADAEEARRRGLDGFRFFGFALAHYYLFGSHKPGRTNIWENFEAVRDAMPDMGAVAGGIGTPDDLREHLRKFEAT